MGLKKVEDVIQKAIAMGCDDGILLSVRGFEAHPPGW